jgi:hypothetical protein
MSYADDKYNLAAKSNDELHAWLAGYEQGSPEYIAGVEESMRRVAAMEEVMEKNESPVWKRESVAMYIAILAIAVTIIVIVATY